MSESIELIINNLAVASLTVGVYDHLLSFEDEVRYIWSKKMSWLDFLLIAIRYVTIILAIVNVVLNFLNLEVGDKVNSIQTDLPLHSVRTILFYTQAAGNPIVISAADCILALRIWALYRRNNHLLGFLIFLIIFQTAYSILFPMLGYKFLLNIILQYIPNIVSALVMFCLSSGRCVRSMRQNKSRYMPITKMFLRDGVLWFLCALLAIILQMSLLAPSRSILCAPGCFAVVTYSIVSSRILIGMRALGTESDEMVQSSQLTTLAFKSVTQREELTTGFPDT